MNILGHLIAPAGTIKASIDGTVGSNFDGNLSLFVGENALLSAKRRICCIAKQHRDFKHQGVGRRQYFVKR